jgi:hypothetical protein
MSTILALYTTRGAARKAADLIAQRVASANVRVLGPSSAGRDLPSVPKDEAEQPGPGTAIGGVVGGAAGAAGGAALGTAAAAAVALPPLAAGVAAAALLGADGAAVGAAAAHRLDEELFEGVPRDETYVYDDALRQGRWLVAVSLEDEKREKEVREMLESSGAESLDAAREAWWIGLRDAEKAAYGPADGDFEAIEADFRRGFETALRGHSMDPAAGEAYHRGYARGEAFAAARGVKAAV